tara:strand:+ start:125 stop:1048 length:924 start_codon:yes stop_codon:yes gene_type:complete
MVRIKNSFSIKNLEIISGIKAHTIRIWEKRYNLLSPDRTDTNIRKYSINSLRKLLNITILYKNGVKISKIAMLDEIEMIKMVRDFTLKSKTEQTSINAFKLAMVNFDPFLFNQTFDDLIQEKDFESVYMDVFIPLMIELGILWQTDAISPSHEHFITHLIKQKIHIQTNLVQTKKKYSKNQPCFVLFLPENEIHELSLLFLNHLILSKGYRTIFLGQSLPSDSLNTLFNFSVDLHFITYCTVEPSPDKIDSFLKDFNKNILMENKSILSIFGNRIADVTLNKLSKKINLCKDLDVFKAEYLDSNACV